MLSKRFQNGSRNFPLEQQIPGVNFITPQNTNMRQISSLNDLVSLCVRACSRIWIVYFFKGSVGSYWKAAPGSLKWFCVDRLATDLFDLSVMRKVLEILFI